MPMYDRRCNTCERIVRDCWEPISDYPDPFCVMEHSSDLDCAGVLERVYLPTGRGQVLGDECDVMVKHGICNNDGTPKRYTSKAEMKRAAAAKGLENHVVHLGSKGSDKSKHTTRWS